MSEVHELLHRIHDILDKAASQFPFLHQDRDVHSLRDVIPPNEACLYDHINWSLAQAHSVSLCQSFPPKRGGKARPQTGFHFTVHKIPVRVCARD